MTAPRTYRDKLGRIEQVEIELVFVLLGDDLDTKVPFGESAGLWSHDTIQYNTIQYITFQLQLNKCVRYTSGAGVVEGAC